MTERDELVAKLTNAERQLLWADRQRAADQIERDGREIERLREALESCPPTSNPSVTAEYHLERINAWWKNIARAALNGEASHGA